MKHSSRLSPPSTYTKYIFQKQGKKGMGLTSPADVICGSGRPAFASHHLCLPSIHGYLMELEKTKNDGETFCCEQTSILHMMNESIPDYAHWFFSANVITHIEFSGKVGLPFKEKQRNYTVVQSNILPKLVKKQLHQDSVIKTNS